MRGLEKEVKHWKKVSKLLDDSVATFKEKMDSAYRCGVCLTTFHEDTHAPYMLLCGHSLCATAINRMTRRLVNNL